MKLKGCEWRKSWHNLMHDIAIYQQGLRKPVNLTVERRCRDRNLKRISRIRDRYDTDSIRSHVLGLLNCVARFPVRVVRMLSLIPSRYARVSIAFVVCVWIDTEGVAAATYWTVTTAPAYRQYPVSLQQVRRVWKNTRVYPNYSEMTL
jgi:hypothetical protein